MAVVFGWFLCTAAAAVESLIILCANRTSGVKRMTLKRMRVACPRPARCESSQIVNSRHEKAKLGLIREHLVEASSFFETA
jgi:hypothetical protein